MILTFDTIGVLSTFLVGFFVLELVFILVFFGDFFLVSSGDVPSSRVSASQVKCYMQTMEVLGSYRGATTWTLAQ